MVMNIKAAIKKLFGNDNAGQAEQALAEQQTANEARVGQIKRELADHPSRGLNPARLYRILEDAERGDLRAQHELFEDMEEKDCQIASDLAKRRQLAAELEWQIVPPDSASAEEKKAADFCNEVFSGLEVEDLIIEMGSGIGHGWACLELPWTISDGKQLIEQPIFRPHSWFRLHPESQDELRLRDLSANGEELWPLGWARHIHRAKAGYIARGGLCRVLAWPYLFQNYAIGDLAELLEIYGIPARLGTYPSSATPAEKATLLRAVTALGHSAAGIIPEGMAIEFKEAADGKADLFETMIRWCEQSKARAILGNTLTSGTGDGTNTNALGNVHERGQQSLIRSDVRQYAGTINRDLLWPMAAMNFGVEDRRRAPRFFLDTGETEDLKLLADSLPIFVDLGARIPTWWLHEKTKIPQAGEGDEVLISAPAATSRTALRGRTSIAALTAGPLPEAQPFPSDLISERLDLDAQPEIEAWIEQIKGMLDQAESLEHFRELLLAAYDDLPTVGLAKVMTEAMTAAGAAGRFDVENSGG